MVNACKLYSEFAIFLVYRIFLTALGKAVSDCFTDPEAQTL